LCALDVAGLAASDSVIFLWATSPLLDDAIDVLRAWGFKYKASFVWDKQRSFLGHYNHVCHELLLLGTRGSCTPCGGLLTQSIQSVKRTRTHSEKPQRFREIIDQLYPRSVDDRIELFARASAEGWQVWGNEAPQSIGVA